MSTLNHTAAAPNHCHHLDNREEFPIPWALAFGLSQCNQSNRAPLHRSYCSQHAICNDSASWDVSPHPLEQAIASDSTSYEFFSPPAKDTAYLSDIGMRHRDLDWSWTSCLSDHFQRGTPGARAPLLKQVTRPYDVALRPPHMHL